MFCRSLFVFLFFFFWPLYCLSFDIWLLITLLVSLNFSWYLRLYLTSTQAPGFYCIADNLFKLLLRPSVPVQPNTNLEETFDCTSFVFISYYIILLIMYLFSLFYLGADTPVYLAMLPAGTNSPKGNFVSDRTIQNWGWLSNRLWKEYCYLALIKKSHCIVVFAHQLQNLMYKIIVPPWEGGSFKGHKKGTFLNYLAKNQH